MALPVARARATMRARRMQASQDSARDSDTALAFLAFKSNFTVGAGEESAESGKAGFFALAHANEDFADYEVEAVGGLSLGASGLAGHFLNDFRLFHPIPLYQRVFGRARDKNGGSKRSGYFSAHYGRQEILELP